MRIYIRSTMIVALCFASGSLAQTFPTETEMRDGSLFLNSRGLPPLLEYCKGRFPNSAERIVQAMAAWKQRNVAALERGRKLIEDSDSRNAAMMKMSVKEYRAWHASIVDKATNDTITTLKSKSDAEAQAECATYESALAS